MLVFEEESSDVSLVLFIVVVSEEKRRNLSSQTTINIEEKEKDTRIACDVSQIFVQKKIAFLGC